MVVQLVTIQSIVAQLDNQIELHVHHTISAMVQVSQMLLLLKILQLQVTSFVHLNNFVRLRHQIKRRRSVPRVNLKLWPNLAEPSFL
jgi:hypothetical protein